jgi:protein-S-isoprenylcysteine O-methyltransferase Ste14
MEDHADVKIHPPVLAAFHLAAALLIGWLVPITLPAWSMYVGWIIVLLALIVAFSGLRALLAAQTSPNPHSPVTALVTERVYHLTRNPIYVGYLLLVIGFPLLIGNVWGVIAAFVQVPLFNRLVIAHEEEYLARKFGDEYLKYKSAVRRWI